MNYTVEDYLLLLWKKRLLIVKSILGVVLILFLFATLLTKYRVEFFIQINSLKSADLTSVLYQEVPAHMTKESEKMNETNAKEVVKGLPLSDFTLLTKTLVNKEHFKQFAQDQKMDSNSEVKSLIESRSFEIEMSSFIQQSFSPAANAPRNLLGENKEAENTIRGIFVGSVNRNSENLQILMQSVSDYIKDGLMYLGLDEYFQFRINEIKQRIQKHGLDKIKNNRNVKFRAQQIESLKKITQDYARNESSKGGQVIFPTEASPDYLSPAMQIVYNESQILNMREKNKRSDLTLVQDQILLDYYNQAKKFLNEKKQGEKAFDSLEEVKNQVFKKFDQKSEDVEELSHMISFENQKIKDLFKDEYFLISQPTPPVKTGLKTSTLLGLSFFLGLIGSMLYVFATHWYDQKVKSIDLRKNAHA